MKLELLSLCLLFSVSAQAQTINSDCPTVGKPQKWEKTATAAPVDEIQLSCTDNKFQQKHRVRLMHTREEVRYLGELCLSPEHECVDRYQVSVYDLAQFLKGAPNDSPLLFDGYANGNALYLGSFQGGLERRAVSCRREPSGDALLEFLYEQSSSGPTIAVFQLVQKTPQEYVIKYHNVVGLNLHLDCK